MSDSLFPSGPWTGFYTQGPARARHRMWLSLSFVEGRLTGHGDDDIGRFCLTGRYDAASLECHWTKTYLGAHDVFYRGFREGKGIWGTWEIRAFDRGGFHIWPWSGGSGAEESLSAGEPAPAEAVSPDRELTVGGH
jgi:hypothetical protein